MDVHQQSPGMLIYMGIMRFSCIELYWSTMDVHLQGPGMLIYMGIMRFSRIELYWSTMDVHLQSPGVASIMPQVRFLQIFRFLHLTDCQQAVIRSQPGYDRLYKMHPLLGLVIPKFRF